MIITRDLVEKYLKFVYKDHNYINLELSDYSIISKVSVISINYKFDYEEGGNTIYDNILEVCLLDYITFVFNCK